MLCGAVPAHARQLGNVYLCVGPENVQSPVENPFHRPAFGQNGISLTHIVPPPEFRGHDLTRVDASEVGLFRTPRKLISHGQGIHSDELGDFTETII
jgi:hypothetical protein